MRRVSTLLRVLHVEDEGAAAVVVAIMLVVLLGVGAFVLDIGNLFWEQRMQQNSADAAALAIAQDCAEGDCKDYETTADDYAEENTFRGSHVLSIEPETLTAHDHNEVTVTTTTGDTAEAGTLATWLAGVLGREEIAATTKATAAWGPPAGLRIFPLSFCIGKFNEVTDNGVDYGWPTDPEDGYRIHYHHEEENVDCELDDDSENDDYPGGFGWIDVDEYDDETDDDCHLIASEDEWYHATTGVGLPAAAPWDACFDFIDMKVDDVNQSRDNGVDDPCADPDGSEYVEPVLVPIFNKHRGQGDSGEIHVEGFGAFCPTGFNFGGNGSNPDNQVCGSPQNRCIRGWFNEFIEIGEVVAGGSNDFGVGTFGLID